MTGRPIMRQAATWTAVLTVAWAVIAQLWWGSAMALGVVTGGAVGGLNIWLLGRALDKVVAEPEQHRNAKRKLPKPILLKWPLTLALLGAVLWFFPVRVEGVAMGAIISLLALIVAAFREQRAAASEEP